MSIKDCVKIKGKLTDPDDKALFEQNLKDLTESGVPPKEAYPQAAELTMEELLKERNDLAKEIRSKKGYVKNLTIEKLLSPPKRYAADVQTDASGQYVVPRRFTTFEYDQEIEAAQEKPDFSRKPRQGSAQKKQVEDWISKPKGKLGKWVVVKVVDQPFIGMPDDARGVKWKGKVYLFANNIPDKAAALETFAHEVVGHLGVETLLGKEGFDLLISNIRRMKEKRNQAIVKKQVELRKNYVDENGKYMLDEQQEAREIIAHLAETHPRHSIIRELWNKIKMWLKENGWDLGLVNYDAEMIQRIIFRASRLTQTEGDTKPPADTLSKSELAQRIVDHMFVPPDYSLPGTLYSALTKQVADIRQEKGSKQQWKGMINKLTQKGVKQEEIDWSGVIQYIEDGPDRISKAKILDYIEGNEVQLKETVKEPVSLPESRKYLDSISELMDQAEEGQLTQADGDSLFSAITDRDISLEDVIGEVDDLVNAGVFSDELADKITDGIKEYHENVREKETRHGSYVTPGQSDNYKEVLVIMPLSEYGLPPGYDIVMRHGGYALKKPGDWFPMPYPSRGAAVQAARAEAGLPFRMDEESEGVHWSEKNVIGWVRFNDRKAEGKKTLFIEELQSDWHQKGRKYGYRKPIAYETYKELPQGVTYKYTPEDRTVQIYENGKWVAGEWPFTGQMYNMPTGKEFDDAIKESALRGYQNYRRKQQNLEANNSLLSANDAPFKKTWPLLMVKRMIRHAAENGYDQVAWTPGSIQAERYNRDVYVADVYYREMGGLYDVRARDEQNNVIFERSGMDLAEIADAIDPQTASDIEADKGQGTDWGEKTLNVNRKIKDEKMRAFYDRIVPKMIGKYIKGLGGTVGTTRLEDGTEVWQFNITPAMKKAAKEGQPMFSRKSKKPAATKLTQSQMKGDLAQVKKDYPEVYDAAMARMKTLPKAEKKLMKINLEKHKGTPWAAAAIKSLATRHIFDLWMAGENPTNLTTSEYFGKAGPETYKTIKGELTRGTDGLKALAKYYDFIGNNRKAENHVSGSFVNCDPSKACAKFCYATANLYPAEIPRAELTELAIEMFPEEVADNIGTRYKSGPAGMSGLSLRLNDKGDLSANQVALIKKLNDKGIALQVFSKRPELLRELSDINWKALSVDDTNFQQALDNPDLNLAFTITENTTEDMLKAVNDRVAVYLPVNLRGKEWTAKELKSKYPAIFGEMKSKICPVEGGGVKTQRGVGFVDITEGMYKGSGIWTCTACDKLGAVGCFHGKRKTENRKKAFNLYNIEVNEQKPVNNAITDLEKELKKLGVADNESVRAALGKLRSGIGLQRPEPIPVATPENDQSRSEKGERDTGTRTKPTDKPAYSRKQIGRTSTMMVVGKDADGNEVSVPTTHPSQNRQNKLKTWYKKWFFKEGNLGKAAFAMRTEMEGTKNADENNVKFFVANMQRAVKLPAKKGGFGRRYTKLSDTQHQLMNDYLQGEDVKVPKAVAEALDIMRTTTDALSGKVQESIRDNIGYRIEQLSPEKQNKALAAISSYFRGEEVDWEGVDDYIVRKTELLNTIQGNKGKYLTRSYELFDDPNWEDKVLKNEELIQRAKDFFRENLEDQYEGQDLIDAVDGAINSILAKGEHRTDMLSFMSSPLLGQKNLSILKKRKDIPKVIRELMGEYEDPRINFARSVSKMSYLVANHHFLKGVRDNGIGVFLSKKPRGRYADKIEAFERESMMPLAGLYATPEFVQALREATEPVILEGWLKYAMGANSAVKYGKTVLSPTTAMRNFYSAAMFTVMNGHFNYLKTIKAAQHTFADLASRNMSRRAYLDKLIRLGVLHNNPYSAELKAALDDFADMDTYKDNAVNVSWKTVLNVAQRFYQSGDDFWKIVGYENDKAMLMKQGMTERKAEKESARRIRDGYPTYSMVPKSIRALRRFPFVGTFTSFPYEILRTSYHQLELLKEDFQAKRTAAVAKRSVGISISMGLAYGISQALMTMMGLDDEDDENIRELAPEWQRNSQLAYLPYTEDGVLRYLDLSHLDPYTYLKKPITALMNDNNEGLDEKVIDAAVELLSPFFSEEIGFGAVNDAFYNINHDTGKPIVPPGATPFEAATGISKYLWKNLGPGFAMNAERLYKAQRGIIERSGRTYNMYDETAAVLGFRLTSLDIPSSLAFKSFQFIDDKRGASGILSGVAKSRGTVTKDQLQSAYDRMIRSRKKIYTDMINSIKASQALGLDDTTIYNTLISARVGQADAKALIKHKIPDWRPTKSYIKEVAKRSLRVNKDATKRLEIRRRFQEREKMLREVMQ